MGNCESKFPILWGVDHALFYKGRTNRGNLALCEPRSRNNIRNRKGALSKASKCFHEINFAVCQAIKTHAEKSAIKTLNGLVVGLF